MWLGRTEWRCRGGEWSEWRCTRVRALPGQPGLLASTVPIASGMIPCSFAKLESHKHLLVPVAALVSSGQEQEGRWCLAGWEEARVEAQG